MRKLYVALDPWAKTSDCGQVKSQDQVQTKQEQVVAASGQELVMNRALRRLREAGWIKVHDSLSGRHLNLRQTY